MFYDFLQLYDDFLFYLIVRSGSDLLPVPIFDPNLARKSATLLTRKWDHVWASVKELNSVEIFRHWSSMTGRCSRRCPPNSQPIETWLRTSGWGQIQKKSGRIRSLSQSSSELQVRIPILDFLNQP